MTNLTLQGLLTVNPLATLNIVSGNSKTLYGSTIVNNGTVAWDGGTLYFNNGTIVTNNGTWLAETDDQIYNPYSGAPPFYNNGTFTKSPTTGTTTINGIFFANTGSVNALTGTINFDCNCFMDGTFASSTGAQILFSAGTFTYGPAVNMIGAGPDEMTGGAILLTNNPIPNFLLNGGTVTLGPLFQGGTITNLILTGGTLSGSNTLTGVMHWQSGQIAGVFNVASSGTLYLDGAVDVSQYAALTNAGHIVWNGSANWRLYNSAGIDGTINNLSSGIIDFECNQTMSIYQGAPWFNNSGLVRKMLSTATTTVNEDFTNAGTLEVLSGALTLGNGAFGGQIEVANGTVLTLNNGGVLSGSFTAGAQASVNLTAGTFTQTPSISLAGPGNYDMSGGTLTLLNNLIPNLQLTGGTIDTGPAFQGGSITNLTLNGPSTGNSNYVTGQLTVIGNIQGPVTVASNAVLTWTGSANAQIIAEPGAILNWNGNNSSMGVPFYLPTNAVLNLGGPGLVQFNDNFTNAGTINWTGGSVRMSCDQPFYNEGVFNIECDQTFNEYCGGEIFYNSGVLRKLATTGSATTATTSWTIEVNNAGLVDVEQGDINFDGAGYVTNTPAGIIQCAPNAAISFYDGAAISATFNTENGGTIDLAGGTFTLVPPYYLNGTGVYEMTGGTLTLTTNVIPNLQLAGGTINTAPGFQGGSITNLTLNGASTGSSNYVTGQLTVNGNINAPVTVASNAILTWTGSVSAQITAKPGAILNWNGNGSATMGVPFYLPTNAVLNLGGPGLVQFNNSFTNFGDVNWTGGSVRMYCGEPLYNEGVFNIECDQSFSEYCGTEMFYNSGILRKLTTTGTTYWNVEVNNAGLVDVEQGDITFQNAGYVTNTPTGIIQCASNTTINFDDGAAISATFNNENGGAIHLAGGNFTFVPPYYLNGTGTYEMTGGTITLLTNLIPDLTLIGGTIDAGPAFQGGSITNLTLNGLNTGNSNYVTGQLTVIGAINAPVTVASNAVLTWNGTVNAPIIAEPGAILNWEGGDVYAPLYIPTNSVLNVAGPAFMQIQGAFTNAGTVNWTGGSLRIYCGLALYNEGVFNIECDQTFYYYCATEVFYNSGVLRKLATTGTTTIQPELNNTGMIDAQSGQIQFISTVTQTGGTWNVFLDGLANNGKISFSDAAPLPATLNVLVTNGYVLGLSNSFTLATYPSVTGTIGATNLPADGAAWMLNAGSTALTLSLTNLKAPQNLTITSPANNQSFTIPVNIPLTATVSDPYAAISSVKFYYQGTNLIGQGAGSGPYTYTWNSVQPASYELSAVAVDASGAVATSAPVNITVYYNHAQTTNYTWTGAVSSDWFTAGNWTPNGVPGVLDNATLAIGSTISLSSGVSINNLTVSSGTISGAGKLTVTNSGTWTAGAIACPLTIFTNGTLAIGGSVNLQGAVLVNNGTVTWSAGLIQGSGASAITNNGLWLAESGNQINSGLNAFVNNGIFRVITPGTVTANCPSFVNNGTVDVETGTLYIDSGGTLSGTYNAAAGADLYFGGGSFSLGVLPAFTGAGAFEFVGGTLNIAATVAPALQLVGGTVVLGAGFQNVGAITNLTLAGSTLQGIYTVKGTMNWSAGGISGKLTVSSGSTLNISGPVSANSSSLVNSGTVVWTTANYFSGDANTAITNNGTWLAEGDGRLSFGNGNAIFVNNALFQKTNSFGTTYFSGLTFVNNGTVDAENGNIDFESGGALTGTYNAASGAEINFDGGTFSLSDPPVFTGAGLIRVTGGTMNIANGIPSDLQLVGGTVVLGPGFQNGGKINNLTNSGSTLSGNYTVTGTLTWLGGSIQGSLTVASNATLNIVSTMYLSGSLLTNNGTINWTGGGIIGSGVILNNGLIAASPNNYAESLVLTNNGVFRTTASTTEFSSATLVNNGLVDVEGASTLSFYSGGVIAGTYNVAQYATLMFAGGSFTAAAPPTITASGISEFTGGTLTLLVDQISNLVLQGGTVDLGSGFQRAGAITNLTISGSTLGGSNTVAGTLNWNAGAMNGGWLTVASNGLLNFNLSNAKNMPNSVLVNNGTVAWNGGSIQGNSSTFITNNSLWAVEFDNTVLNNAYGGTPIFVNAGTFSKSGTYGTTYISGVSFLNSGTLDLESGSLVFENSGTYAQTGATLEFGVTAPGLTGFLDVPAPVNLDGTLTVHFLSGYTPAIGDSLELIDYTGESGVFANLNLPALPAGQNWDLEYGGSLDLHVTGALPAVTNNLKITGSVTTTGNQPVTNVTVYASLAGSNLVQNGSFEEPNIGSTAYEFYPLGSTAITGWTVVGRAGANVAITSYDWSGPAEDGNQFLDPTGNTGGGGITQTIPTAAGTTYDLIFYHGTYSHVGNPACLGVTIGTNSYSYGETSGGAGNFDWRQVVIPFTAVSNQTALTFSDLNGADDNNNFVDNVQVIQPGLGTVAQGVTDSNGNYQIAVPNGAFQVGVGGLITAGYNSVLQQMVVMANANQVVNFTTTPLSVSEEFTITTAVNPAGAGTASSGGTYREGTLVTVTASRHHQYAAVRVRELDGKRGFPKLQRQLLFYSHPQSRPGRQFRASGLCHHGNQQSVIRWNRCWHRIVHLRPDQYADGAAFLWLHLQQLDGRRHHRRRQPGFGDRRVHQPHVHSQLCRRQYHARGHHGDAATRCRDGCRRGHLHQWSDGQFRRSVPRHGGAGCLYLPAIHPEQHAGHHQQHLQQDLFDARCHEPSVCCGLFRFEHPAAADQRHRQHCRPGAVHHQLHHPSAIQPLDGYQCHASGSLDKQRRQHPAGHSRHGRMEQHDHPGRHLYSRRHHDFPRHGRHHATICFRRQGHQQQRARPN